VADSEKKAPPRPYKTARGRWEPCEFEGSNHADEDSEIHSERLMIGQAGLGAPHTSRVDVLPIPSARRWMALPAYRGRMFQQSRAAASVNRLQGHQDARACLALQLNAS
jgi:hypothetical protein